MLTPHLCLDAEGVETTQEHTNHTSIETAIAALGMEARVLLLSLNRLSFTHGNTYERETEPYTDGVMWVRSRDGRIVGFSSLTEKSPRSGGNDQFT